MMGVWRGDGRGGDGRDEAREQQKQKRDFPHGGERRRGVGCASAAGVILAAFTLVELLTDAPFGASLLSLICPINCKQFNLDTLC